MNIIKNLLSDSSIIVARGNKGCVTLIIDRPLYDDKAFDFLNDIITNKDLKRGLIPSIQMKLNSLIGRLEKESLDFLLARNLVCYIDFALIFYGLSKILKLVLPFHSIVDYTKFLLYILSRFFSC